MAPPLNELNIRTAIQAPSIINHGLFFNKSFRSSFKVEDSTSSGSSLSLVPIKVSTKNTPAIIAYIATVFCYAEAKSPVVLKYSTK